VSSHHAVREDLIGKDLLYPGHVVGSDGDLHTEHLADQVSHGGELSGVEGYGAGKDHLEIRVHAARCLEVRFSRIVLPLPLPTATIPWK